MKFTFVGLDQSGQMWFPSVKTVDWIGCKIPTNARLGRRARVHCLWQRLVIAALLGLAARVGAAEPVKGRTLAVEYDFARPRVDPAGDHWRVLIPGCENEHKAGEISLPFRTARILLPPGCRLTEVSARMTGVPIPLELPGPIERGAVPVPTSTRGNANWTTALPRVSGTAPIPDPGGSVHPQERVQLISVQRMGGHDIALLRIFPAQLLDDSQRLDFHSRIAVVLTLSDERDEETGSGSELQRGRAAERVATFVDNPGMLAEFAAPKVGPGFEPAGQLDPPAVFDYLLVTKAFLLPAFQPLVSRKIVDGLAVKTEALENILASQPGRDAPEKLRNFIRYACTNWGIRYVLLGGDIDTVPCRYAYVSANQPVFDSYIPCDLYYSCLDGSWNGDGDARWGEPTDGENGGDVDLLGEVYVGRAPVDTVEEAAIWVAKTIRYEIDGNPNAGNAQFLAMYLGFYAPGVDAQGGDMLDPLLPLFSRFTVGWLDDRPFTTPQWGGVNALAALNRSPHVVIYNGHGDVDSIMQLGLGDVDSLTNRDLFLVYSVGCNAGEFDNDPFSPDCIGEQLLTRHNRGAFAAILNSRLGWFNPQNEEQFSGEFQTRFFDHLLARGQTRLGVAHQLSKQDMVGHLETSGVMTYRWCYYEINLLGDPHVELKPPYSGITPQGTPHWWLASHGWTNNFEGAALADVDGDGAPAWEEFVAGTSPVDARSALKVTCVKPPASGAVLRWPSTATRTYSVYRSTNLALGTFTLLTNGLSATPPTNDFVDSTGDAGPRFYRIGVRSAP